MGFWTIVFGTYGGGTASVTPTESTPLVDIELTVEIIRTRSFSVDITRTRNFSVTIERTKSFEVYTS